MSDLPVFEMPTTYTVSALPTWHRDWHYFAITVQYRGLDHWAVCTPFGECLGADGEWDHESVPSERADDWLATHRFDRDTALAMARDAAPKVRVNGFTAREVAEETAAAR